MKISIRSVLHEVNRAGSVFAVRYRKVANGEAGEHKRCTLRKRETNAPNQHKRWNRSGQLRLVDLDTGQTFQIYIDLLTHFNSTEIDHQK